MLAAETGSDGARAEWRAFWVVPLVAALGYSSSVIHIYSMGPFFEPLQQAFGWSRSQAAVGIAIASFISGIFCIPIGLLIDRIGPRPVGLVGVLLMGAAFAGFGTATGSAANWALLWVAAAFAALWVQASVWTSAVASRFQASRGLAFAITLCGASLAATVFPVLATWLISTVGWRSAFTAMGALWAALVFPLLLLFFRGARDTPAGTATSAPAAITTAGLTLAQGFRSPALYKLLLAGGLFSFTAIGAMVHFVPILRDRGAEAMAAAGVASLIGVFSIVGRLGTGVLLDRFAAHRVGATVFLLPIAAMLLLLLDGANPVSQMAAAAVLGLSLGSEIDVIAYLAARHFGLRNFGALYGALLMSLSLGTATGPLAAGAIFDGFGSYTGFLGLTSVFMALSALTLLSLDPDPRADAVSTA